MCQGSTTHLDPAGALPAQLTDALPPQFDNQWYLALVNKWADEVAKAGGSAHTFAQVQLLRSVVRALLRAAFVVRVCLCVQSLSAVRYQLLSY